MTTPSSYGDVQGSSGAAVAASGSGSGRGRGGGTGRGGPPPPPAPPPRRPLRILALHGSRQDGGVFAARLKTLQRKLQGIAELDFADAPHELPLEDGQAVAMRAWWRHWALDDTGAAAADDDDDGGSESGRPDGDGTDCHKQQEQEQRKARAAATAAALSAGWGARVVEDWRASRRALEAVLTGPRGPYDGVLGFSNGAAAAYLLAASVCAAQPQQGSSAPAAPPPPPPPPLRFVVLAGGYVPQPLAELLPGAMARHGQQPPRPLPLPSLHFAGTADPVVVPADSAELAELFDAAAGREVVVHSGGHCFPQRAAECAALAAFLARFLDGGGAGGGDGGGAGAGGLGRARGGRGQKSSDDVKAPLRQPQQKQKQKQQQERPPKQPPSFDLAVAPSAAEAPLPTAAAAAPRGNGGVGRAELAAVDAVAPFDATPEQLEELDALEAIYGPDCFSRGAARPPRCAIRLAQEGGGGGGGDGDGARGPPSGLFTLRVAFTPGYPSDEDPALDVEGPLARSDPRRAALLAHLHASCAEQRRLMGGAGYVYALVDAAREWVDANLPADVGERPGGGGGGAGLVSGAAAERLAAASLGEGGGGAADGAAAAAAMWWEAEEADMALMRAAIDEAAAAQWAAWRARGGDGDGDEDGADDDESGAAAAGIAAADGDAAAAAGGQRGEWPYTVGLVGKPSAGKSSLFNALTDPEDDRSAAKVGAFPFTTIAPNCGRGCALLPDPAPLLGLRLEQAQPAYGYVPGFGAGAVAAATAAAATTAGASSSGTDSTGQPPTRSLPARVAPLLRLADGFGGAACAAWRRVPVTVKDVAGLVPGAWQGRGRGNAFLNDLCDADVLIHVIDAAAATAADGGAAPAGEGSDPVDDVRWVREEVHLWVYSNVRAKWAGVLRRPTRLMGLFSGYHAPRALVAAVLARVGVRPEDLATEEAAARRGGAGGGGPPGKEALLSLLASAAGTAAAAGGSTAAGNLAAAAGGAAAAAPCVRGWREADLHRLVAHFVAARFPILLALNKADLPSAARHVPRVLAAFPHDAAVPVSARAEARLHELRRLGLVEYAPGAPSALARRDNSDAAAAAAVEEELAAITARVLGPLGGTGAALAVATALALRPPRWCFPVADRESLLALAAGPRGGRDAAAAGPTPGAAASAADSSGGTGNPAHTAAAGPAPVTVPGVLRDCVLMRRGSRVRDVYEVLRRPPHRLLDGELVRAECAVLPAAPPAPPQPAPPPRWRPARKDEPLGPANCVLLLQTNRKTSWQAQYAAARHHAHPHPAHHHAHQQPASGAT